LSSQPSTTSSQTKIRVSINRKLYKFSSIDEIPERYRDHIKPYLANYNELHTKNDRVSMTYCIRLPNEQIFLHLKGVEPKRSISIFSAWDYYFKPRNK